MFPYSPHLTDIWCECSLFVCLASIDQSRVIGEMESNRLPREVLRWLQSLDLSFAVRNVKRDFSNGFLFAEICWRHFENEINVHSFTNGTGLPGKKDNWFQLCRFFAKVGVPCEPKLVNEVMHCKDGAAMKLILRVYESFTQRNVQVSEARSKKLQIPAFAKETASRVIKRKLREPDMIMIQDEALREASLVKVLEEHNSQAQEERRSFRELSQSTESKFSELSQNYSQQHQHQQLSASLQLLEEEGKRAEPIQQVQVRQVDLRQVAGFESRIQSRSRSQTTDSSYFRDETASKQSVSLFSGLEAAIRDAVECQPIRGSFVEGRSFFREFIRINVNETQHFDDETLENIFNEMVNFMNGVVGPVIFDEAWSIIDGMISLFEFLDSHTLCFNRAVEVTMVFGRLLHNQHQIAKNDVEDLMWKTCSQRLKIILETAPEKRHACLSVLNSFVEQEPNKRALAIKKLRSLLRGESVFLQCLTILIYMEETMAPEGPGLTLLDVYAYFAFSGLESSSPNLRAAALAMFSVIVEFDPRCVERLIPRLIPLANDDEWWEVQCQLVIASSKILDVLSLTLHSKEASRDTQGLQKLHNCKDTIIDKVLGSVFHVNAPMTTQKIGLVYLGHHLGLSQRLAKDYVTCLLQLARNAFVDNEVENFAHLKLLGFVQECDELPLQSSCGGKYVLPRITSNWDAIAVAEQLEKRTEKLENLEPWHFEVLNALLGSQQRIEEELEEEECSDGFQEKLFQTFNNFVFAALCDPQSFNLATEILRRWILNHEFNVAAEKTFKAVLRLLFGQQAEGIVWAMQKNVADLFLELRNAGSRLSSPMAALVADLCTDFPELLSNDILSTLEENLNQSSSTAAKTPLG